jgi:glycosyltransferase involved in cell wall biosynthesis
MNEPLVSVVIAVKNGERFLGEAIDSARAQTWSATEILVVDGQSTDRSREIALSYPGVRVVLQQGTGFAGAWNEGIRSARGAYIAFLDSDDCWEPTKLALQVAALETNPACGYALAQTRFFRMEGAALPPGFERVDLDKAHAAPFPSAVLVRRRLFDEVGLFDEQWSIANDVEWFRRVYDYGIGSVLLPEVLVHRRIHGANLSYRPPDPSAFNRELLSILKSSLDRRRKAPAAKGTP